MASASLERKAKALRYLEELQLREAFADTMMQQRESGQAGVPPGSQIPRATENPPVVLDAVDTEIRRRERFDTPGPEIPIDNDIPDMVNAPIEDDDVVETQARFQNQPSGPRSSPDNHVAKAQRGDNSRVVTSTDKPTDAGRRRSERQNVKTSRGKHSTASTTAVIQAKDLPPKEFSLVKLLVSGAQPDEQLEDPGDTLPEAQGSSLRAWWTYAVGKEQWITRFNAWFGGKSTGGCLFSLTIKKGISEWKHGTDFACADCIQQKRPCFRALVDEASKQVTVVVLPEAGLEDDEAFGYWQWDEKRLGKARQ